MPVYIHPAAFTHKTQSDSDHLYTLKLPKGERITVLDRITGFSGHLRDTETGYRNAEGKFWLGAGDFDIREYKISIKSAIIKIKEHSNICRGY